MANQALSYHMLQPSLEGQQGPVQVPQGCGVEQDMVVTMEVEPASYEEMVRQDNLLGGNEEIEIQQDTEITLALDPKSGGEMVGQGTLAGRGGVEIEQDMEMMSALDSATGGEEMLRQDTLSPEPQAEQQAVERDQDEEEQVAILLESREAEPTTGKQNRQALKGTEY